MCELLEGTMEFYEMQYGGSKIPKSERARILRRAGYWLGLLTGLDRKLLDDPAEPVFHALCAAADAIYELEKRVILKEQNGDLSVTYGAKLSTTERQLVWQAIYPYLAWRGVLYRGVREC